MGTKGNKVTRVQYIRLVISLIPRPTKSPSRRLCFVMNNLPDMYTNISATELSMYGMVMRPELTSMSPAVALIKKHSPVLF